MNSLETKSFLLLFNQANIDIQREIMSSLLKTKCGEESIRQIKLNNMLIWFENPIVRYMVEQCEEAQNHFLKYKYTSAWENINAFLPSWIKNENISTFVSDSNDMIYICPTNTDHSDIVIRSVTLRYIKDFDFKAIIKTFNLNNLYMGYHRDYDVWWKHCDNMA